MNEFPSNTELNMRERGSYDFREPLRNSWSELCTSLLGMLCATRAFQRLKHIAFLGAIDYALVQSPNYKKGGKVRHSRFHHSRGVARLAMDYASRNALSLSDTFTVISAALLHDIGHSPFSHTLEPIFIEMFGVGHHTATEKVIKGENLLGKEVYGVLRDQAVDVERVLALISGQDTAFHGLFSGPINFDTIEGIMRSYLYIADSNSVPNPHLIVDASTHRETTKDREIVDRFWDHKGQVYKSLIQSNIGIISDHLCRVVVLENLRSITVEDYFSSDLSLLKRIPKLKRALKCAYNSYSHGNLAEHPIEFKMRDFFVDPHYDFFLRDDSGRYRQTKLQTSLRTSPPNIEIGRFDMEGVYVEFPRQLELF